ncbi:MAG: 5'-nucleotidase C-terminal domain-containing protein [Candidatus Eisenbacteria bacterium]|nr:5'-nucleotidase C-terminal domain-containing protein [Candidatus Eisenbacteria bacterium]
MKKRTVLPLFLLAALLAAAGCGDREPVRLVLLSTNDMHGALESARFEPGTDRPLGGAASFAAYLRAIREEAPGTVILLDAGDIFQGTALSDHLEGRPMTAVMNVLGYDAAAVGNHEFDRGAAVLEERVREADFPFLAANLTEKSTGSIPSWLRPYVILGRSGMRVAVIGLSTPETPRTTLPSAVAPFDFLEPAASAQAWIDRLVPDSADAAVLLVHIGGNTIDEGRVRGPIEQLTREVRGEAAVFGGHSHRTFAVEVDGTPVVMAGSSLRAFSRIDLLWDRREKRILSAEARVVSIRADSLPPDPEVEAMVRAFADEAGPLLRRVVGVAPSPIDRGDGESAVANLFCDAVRNGLGLDVYFENPGGIRASLPAGEITYADAHRVIPFDNTVVVFTMTARGIEDALREATAHTGFLHVSGIRYVVDRRGPAGPEIRDLRDDAGRLLEAGRVYRVGVNSFVAEGGDGLGSFARLPGSRDTMILTRDLFVRELEERTAAGRPIEARVEGRIRFLD